MLEKRGAGKAAVPGAPQELQDPGQPAVSSWTDGHPPTAPVAAFSAMDKSRIFENGFFVITLCAFPCLKILTYI